MALTTGQIAAQLHGELIGDANVIITGIAPAESARPGNLTFAESERYFAAAEQSQAAAILVSGPFTSTQKTVIRVANARISMARLLPVFFPPETHPQGIHPNAVIDPSAQIDSTAYIGPHCVIRPRVRIGARSALMAANYIGPDCRIGDDVCLHPNVL